jgi:hypothetical protein
MAAKIEDEVLAPTDVSFVPKSNFFLMRVPEYNSIQRWSLDDMTKYSKIDATDYSDMFLETLNNSIYFFGFKSSNQKVYQYDITTMKRVGKSPAISTATSTSVKNLVPMNTISYGINPVLLMESSRCNLFNWLGQMQQVGGQLSYYVNPTYKTAVGIDYMPWVVILGTNNFSQGSLSFFELWNNNGNF